MDTNKVVERLKNVALDRSEDAESDKIITLAQDACDAISHLQQERHDEAWKHAACLSIADTGDVWGKNIKPSLAMKAVYALKHRHMMLYRLMSHMQHEVKSLVQWLEFEKVPGYQAYVDEFNFLLVGCELLIDRSPVDKGVNTIQTLKIYQAMNEASAALAGCREVLGAVANIDHARDLLNAELKKIPPEMILVAQRKQQQQGASDVGSVSIPEQIESGRICEVPQGKAEHNS